MLNGVFSIGNPAPGIDNNVVLLWNLIGLCSIAEVEIILISTKKHRGVISICPHPNGYATGQTSNTELSNHNLARTQVCTKRLIGKQQDCKNTGEQCYFEFHSAIGFF